MDEDIWRRLICYCDDEYISRIKAYSLNWQEASITFQFYDGTYEIFYYMEETWFKIGKLPMSKEKMNEYFGHKLQKYMYMHAMTQHRLAIASGISQHQISEYIRAYAFLTSIQFLDLQIFYMFQLTYLDSVLRILLNLSHQKTEPQSRKKHRL